MRVYTCRRAAEPIAIDGMLDDDAWAQAEAVPLRLHDDSGFPTMETLARLCYDNEHLYVSFECRDTEIQATWTNRDDPIFKEEVVEIFLDPDSDLLEYYEFEVSPRNVVFDATVKNPTGAKCELDTSWDCAGFNSAVRIDDAGNWRAELAIPFSSLETAPNSSPRPGDQWRMNLYRIERVPAQEYMCWSPTLAEPANFHVPGRFGILRFE